MVLKRADTFGLLSYLCPLEGTLHDIFSLLKLKNAMTQNDHGWLKIIEFKSVQI